MEFVTQTNFQFLGGSSVVVPKTSRNPQSRPYNVCKLSGKPQKTIYNPTGLPQKVFTAQFCLCEIGGQKHLFMLTHWGRRYFRKSGWVVKTLRGFTFIGDAGEK